MWREKIHLWIPTATADKHFQKSSWIQNNLTNISGLPVYKWKIDWDRNQGNRSDPASYISHSALKLSYQSQPQWNSEKHPVTTQRLPPERNKRGTLKHMPVTEQSWSIEWTKKVGHNSRPRETSVSQWDTDSNRTEHRKKSSQKYR